MRVTRVVICFQISIFDTIGNNPVVLMQIAWLVVICFQISIFDTIGNNSKYVTAGKIELWFAFKLVSLIPLETTIINDKEKEVSCDLLSN